MKILHVLYSGLGGHGNVFFSLVQADTKRKFRYEALFVGNEMREEYADRCKTYNIPFLFIKKNPGKHFAFYQTVFKAVRKSDAGVIFLHGSMQLPPVWLAKLLKKGTRKIIVRETQAVHLKTTKEKAALRIAMQLADNIVFLSEEYKMQIKSDLGKQYISSKVRVIPNGIDLDFFSPTEALPSQIIKIGMQSRIVAIKDHKTLLEAFALVKQKFSGKQFSLMLAGEGELLEEIKMIAEALNIGAEVIFTGMLSENELPAFLNELYIYIHASLGETMSTAIMQAMACRKAIIASDVPGINNMVFDNKTGLLVAPLAKEAMADAIEKLITDRDLHQRLAEDAKTYARINFSNTLMFEKYSELF